MFVSFRARKLITFSFKSVSTSSRCKGRLLTFNEAITTPFLDASLLRFFKTSVDLDCVHTMPAHFENDEKCDGSKI